MKPDPLVSRSGRPVSSRAALAISHAISESKIRPEIVPFGTLKVDDGAEPDYFKTLLGKDGCKDAWETYTKVTTGFPAQLANGTLPLNGFRHYNVQDAIYLEYYVRVRTAAIGAWAFNVSTDELIKFASTVKEGLDYSTNTRSDVCENQLGVPKTVVDKEGKSQQLETSITSYEKVIEDAIKNKDNSWIDIYFALLPCIKGYYEIASKLDKDNTTLKKTLYYKLWIGANLDDSFVKDYDGFLESNTKGAKPEDWDRWAKIFVQSCANELSFFDLALKGYPLYNIVNSDLSYTIQPFGNDIQFLGGDKGDVTISSTPALWKIVNSAEGYSVKLGDKQQYLGYDSNQKKVVIQNADTTKWSINRVYVPSDNVTYYQLFLGPAAKSALDFDNTTKQISVKDADNDAVAQRWILTI